MQDKLKELTDKLYNEGLSKGKEEGAAIVARANQEAENIIDEAYRKAELILSKAEKEAVAKITKTESDVRMASIQAIQSTKKKIEDLVITKLADNNISDALSSSEFIKEMIKSIIAKFNADEAMDLDVVLPESMNKELEIFVNKELNAIAKENITVQFSKKISEGFTIGPKDGGYFISFTDEAFKSLIGEYLRPATKKIIFGE